MVHPLEHLPCSFPLATSSKKSSCKLPYPAHHVPIMSPSLQPTAWEGTLQPGPSHRRCAKPAPSRTSPMGCMNLSILGACRMPHGNVS